MAQERATRAASAASARGQRGTRAARAATGGGGLAADAAEVRAKEAARASGGGGRREGEMTCAVAHSDAIAKGAHPRTAAKPSKNRLPEWPLDPPSTSWILQLGLF